jgi:hypothetical protein
MWEWRDVCVRVVDDDGGRWARVRRDIYYVEAVHFGVTQIHRLGQIWPVQRIGLDYERLITTVLPAVHSCGRATRQKRTPKTCVTQL